LNIVSVSYFLVWLVVWNMILEHLKRKTQTETFLMHSLGFSVLLYHNKLRLGGRQNFYLFSCLLQHVPNIRKLFDIVKRKNKYKQKIEVKNNKLL